MLFFSEIPVEKAWTGQGVAGWWDIFPHSGSRRREEMFEGGEVDIYNVLLLHFYFTIFEILWSYFYVSPTYVDSRWPNSLNLQVAFYWGFVPGAHPPFREEDAQWEEREKQRTGRGPGALHLVEEGLEGAYLRAGIGGSENTRPKPYPTGALIPCFSSQQHIRVTWGLLKMPEPHPRPPNQNLRGKDRALVFFKITLLEVALIHSEDWEQ